MMNTRKAVCGKGNYCICCIRNSLLKDMFVYSKAGVKEREKKRERFCITLHRVQQPGLQKSKSKSPTHQHTPENLGRLLLLCQEHQQGVWLHVEQWELLHDTSPRNSW